MTTVAQVKQVTRPLLERRSRAGRPPRRHQACPPSSPQRVAWRVRPSPASIREARPGPG